MPTKVSVELPDDSTQQLETAWQDRPRGVLTAVAGEGNRSGTRTPDHAQWLPNLFWWDTEVFLQGWQAYTHYDEADLGYDGAALDRALPMGSPRNF